jgi:hypothetical protein
MHLNRDLLRARLASEGIIPGNVGELGMLCRTWFLDEPELLPFILWSIFCQLEGIWDDPQAVPTAKYTPFKDMLLPKLTVVLGLADDQVQLMPAVQALMTTFRDCLVAISIV